MSTVQPLVADKSVESKHRSAWQQLWPRFRRDPLSLISLLVFLLIVLTGIFAPLLAPHDPEATALSLRLRPPIGGDRYEPGYYLGTDKVGRDILTRVIYGSRTALTVAFASVFLSAVLGSIIGLLAAYFGGWADSLINTLVDIMMAFPFILLALAVVSVLGPGLGNLIVVIAVTTWTDYARVVRSEALAIKTKDYVQAAWAMGGNDIRVIFKHVLPNCMSSIIVLSTLAIARVILLSSSLSYLGLGVPPSIPDWGYMLADSLVYITQAPWLGIYPGLAILLTVLSVNLVGDRIRDLLDPKID